MRTLDPKLPLEIENAIRLLRQEAQAKMKIADDLERLYCTSPGADLRAARPNLGVSADGIKEYLRTQGGARVKTLAEFFHVSEDAVMEIIADPTNGLHIAERGWVKHTDLL